MGTFWAFIEGDINKIQTIFNNKKFAISHHANELARFVFDVFSLRLFGGAHLHFGQDTQRSSGIVMLTQIRNVQ